MKIPTRLRYGLRFLIHIAPYYGSDDPISISQVSKDENISNKYLEQIISSFVRAGLIKGMRGKGGGYRLLKNPADITVYDVAKALGEDFSFIPCVNGRKKCPQNPECSTHELWDEMSDAVTKVFMSRKLGDMIRG